MSAKPGARDELVFLPLGGAGEIGMNLNLYGYGPPDARQWLMVDLGIAFGDETMPGIDIIMPDPTYIVEHRRSLLGLVLTHAHEDHIGAVAHLWPELRCPIYATPFTAVLVRGKLAEEGLEGEAKITIVQLGSTFDIGPFSIEFVSITHSIPEPNAIAIRTPLGVVVNTGDWKIDPDPIIGLPTDEAALRRLGDDGVLAMVCDSTNVFVPGRSGSESDVSATLAELIRERTGRVAVTAFASNVARIDSVIRAAEAAGRHVALVGRSMKKIAAAATETGYLTNHRPFVDEADAAYLPPERIVYLCTGSQGEPGSALSRIAGGENPNVKLGEGDTVIYSSRVIPGNEKHVHALQNALAMRGVEILTTEDHMVHVSGHPCRDELADMYRWLRPRIAIPVHGEMRHMSEHARLAKHMQVPEAIVVPNGSMVRLAPGLGAIVDEVPAGRMQLDGSVLIRESENISKARRSLGFAGFVAVTLVLDDRSGLLADPVLIAEGVPPEIVERIEAAATRAAESADTRTRRDDAAYAELVRRAVRREAQTEWGKRPVVRVEVLRLED